MNFNNFVDSLLDLNEQVNGADSIQTDMLDEANNPVLARVMDMEVEVTDFITARPELEATVARILNEMVFEFPEAVASDPIFSLIRFAQSIKQGIAAVLAWQELQAKGVVSVGEPRSFPPVTLSDDGTISL